MYFVSLYRSASGDQEAADKAVNVIRRAVQELRVLGLEPATVTFTGDGAPVSQETLLNEQESDRLTALPPLPEPASASSEPLSAPSVAHARTYDPMVEHGPEAAYPTS